MLNTVAVDATRGFSGGRTEALVHGFATATGDASVALLAGALLVVALLRPAATSASNQPTHIQTTGGTR